MLSLPWNNWWEKSWQWNSLSSQLFTVRNCTLTGPNRKYINWKCIIRWFTSFTRVSGCAAPTVSFVIVKFKLTTCTNMSEHAAQNEGSNCKLIRILFKLIFYFLLDIKLCNLHKRCFIPLLNKILLLFLNSLSRHLQH